MIAKMKVIGAAPVKTKLVKMRQKLRFIVKCRAIHLLLQHTLGCRHNPGNSSAAEHALL
jgi:hypothetical protein